MLDSGRRIVLKCHTDLLEEKSDMWKSMLDLTQMAAFVHLLYDSLLNRFMKSIELKM